MAIKLVKVCPELGVGLGTVVEYCRKIGYDVREDLNARIDDELYILLKKKFIKGFEEQLQKEASATVEVKDVKKPSAKDVPSEEIQDFVSIEKPNVEVKIVGTVDLSAIDPKKKKGEKKETKPVRKTSSKKESPVKKEEEIRVDKTEDQVAELDVKEKVDFVEKSSEAVEEGVKSAMSTPHVVGTIDLEAINKKDRKASKSTAEQIDDTKDKLQPDDAIDETVEVDKVQEEKSVEEVSQPVAEVIEEEKVVVEDSSQEAAKEKEEESIYKIPIPEVVNRPVVVGKIDLSSINPAMRPARKTKQEKIKEREEKRAMQKKSPTADNVAGKQDSDKKDSASNASYPKPVSVKGQEMPVDEGGVSGNDEGQKRKRKRIRSSKVDITSEQRPKFNKNTREKRNYKTEVNNEEVQRQVKDTFARLQGNKGKSSTSKYKRERRELEREKVAEAQAVEQAASKILKLTEFVTANDLAVMMNVPVNKVIATCMTLGILVSINQRLDAETINIVAEEFGFTTEYVNSKLVEEINVDEVLKEEDIERRCPVITVMGHVDHGKTSLLDHIRNSNVIAGEAGGITQHIGAYNVQLKNGQHITFLDTPGHEAFTAMRARGTKITDIAIIVIAADDAVMPQTVEAINHAQAAGVPMIFAINKCDKPGANPEKIKEQLANMNILVEDWGGKYQCQNISAKKGDGVFELLEKVLLEAEMLDLKANPKRRAKGSIVESSLDKGRGYVATVLVSDGTLHMGDIILAGTYHGKIKAMFNERGKRIEKALPGEPCSILGFNGAPQAGDEFNVLPSEHEARSIANRREQLQREQSIRTRKHLGLDEIGRRLAIGDFKEFNIIVKGDVDGSVEALSDSLIKLSTTNIQVNVIHGAVGAISDSDVLLAAASDAIIIGFNVRPTATAKKMAETEEVDIRIYSIIYDAINDVKSAMSGMLSPEIKEEVTATVEVLQTFHISKVGTIAGCIVRDGKVKRTNKCRVIRDGIVIFTGEIMSLKHGKDDVKEMGVNQECGISIKSFNDIKEHDIIETYEQIEVAKPI